MWLKLLTRSFYISMSNGHHLMRMVIKGARYHEESLNAWPEIVLTTPEVRRCLFTCWQRKQEFRKVPSLTAEVVVRVRARAQLILTHVPTLRQDVLSPLAVGPDLVCVWFACKWTDANEKSRTWKWVIVLMMRTFKTYSLSNFQMYYTVLLTVISLLYITSHDLFETHGMLHTALHVTLTQGLC